VQLDVFSAPADSLRHAIEEPLRVPASVAEYRQSVELS